MNSMNSFPKLFIIMFISLALLSNIALAGTLRQFNLDISNFESAPDGVTTNVMGVNNAIQYPIIINKDDTLSVVAKNNLGFPTTVHFHGFFQNGTPYYDGAAGITQCPIPNGETLEYKFDVKQRGTYWWHAHYKSQYVKGLRGPLIIRDPENDPYAKDYDEELIVMLTDWFHARTSEDLLEKFLGPNDSGAEPIPDSGLINGKGRYNCSLIKDDSKPCNPNAPLENFTFEAGKRYRLRIINGASMAAFEFSIDGHKLDIIEADGVETERTSVDSLRISVGQRYSAIVTANAAAGNYWMRADIDTNLYTVYEEGVLDPAIRAVVSYKDTSKAEPRSVPKSSPIRLDPYKLAPLEKSPAPEFSDDFLSFFFSILPDSQNRSIASVSVDGYFDFNQYQMPTSGNILQTLGTETAIQGTSINAATIPFGNTVDLVIYNDDPTEHTFHLHGHNFWVVEHGLQLNLKKGNHTKYDYVPKNRTRRLARRDEIGAGTNIFPKRDTVQVPPCRIAPNGGSGEGICGGSKGFVTIRFIANNPGAWLFHCHMEWHHQQGLAMTFIVPPKQENQITIPQSVQNMCRR